MKKQLIIKRSTILPLGMAFITMVMFCAIANAQIVYTDVTPDTMINSGGGVYKLDLNNDSVVDFRITFTTSSGCGGNNIDIRITPLDSNAVGNTSTYPGALSSNAAIDSSSFVWRNNSNQILAKLEWFWSGGGRGTRPSCRRRILGNWNGLSNRYIPLQLNLNSQKYYGWVRLNVASNAASFTVKDYAYNTKPKHLILAGDTSCTTPKDSLTASGSLTMCSGDRVQFNTKTHFSYQYQWFKDGNAISGAISSSYAAFSAGAYYVNVSNSCGNVNSSIDTVSILAVDTSVTVSGDTLTANAGGATYQWIDCATMQIIAGETSQTFLPSQSGNYAVIVTENSYSCSDTSSCYTVCIAPTVTITSNGPLSICSGDGVQFEARTNFSYNSYQWFKDGNAIYGANSSAYSAYKAVSEGSYYVKVSNSCGNVNSEVKSVSVFTVNTSITVSGDTLTANASSAKYQWIDCSTMQIIPGATAQSYLPSQNGSFAVIVTENACSDTSLCYTVCFQPKVSVASSGPLTICSGDGAQFNATTNFSYNSYQWFKDGQAISGADSSSYKAYSAGAYYVNVSNTCGNVNSKVDTVSIIAVDTSVTVIGNTFTANAAGAKYQWIDCSTRQIIPGATSQSFSPTQNGSYAVIVSENSCSNTSSCYTSCLAPTVSVSTSGPFNICSGDWVQFNTTTDFSYQYQWFKDGNAISGADSSSYKAFSAGAYYVNVSNSCGNVNSDVDTVSVFAVDSSVTVTGDKLTANAVSATYQWIDCSTMQIIPGATAQTFSPSQNGSFAVIVTENSCNDTSSCYSIISTGINENNFASSIALYPNPSANHLTIDLGSTKQKVEITITEISGKVMYSTLASEMQKLELSTQDFKAGIYVVQIQAGDFIGTKKLVVEK